MITFLFEEGGNRRLTDGASDSFHPFSPLYPTLKTATSVILSKTPLKSTFLKIRIIPRKTGKTPLKALKTRKDR